jgi:hypothetical protein
MGPGWIGFLAGIVSAINPVMWSQAVVCEVYSPALMLQATVWLLLAKYVRMRIGSESRDGDCAGLIGWIGILLGLILAHHISGIMIIFPVILILLFYPPENRGKNWVRFVLSMIPGLLLYLYLPIRSSFNPPIDWGNPQTFGNFLRHISAFQYRGNIFGVEWADFYRRLTNPEWPNNWGTLFILLALAGFCVLILSPKKYKRYAVGVPILVYVLWTIIFAFSYNASDYEVFTYPLIMPVAILIAVGTGWVVIMLQKINRLFVWLFVFLAFVFIGFATGQRWLEMNASDPIRNAAANFAHREISLLPENAIVITNSDGQLFSLLYGINVGVIDPISGEKIGPRKDIDALTPYWITTDWFYENNSGTDLAIEEWEPQGIEDYNRLLREFIDMNIANRPVFVDGYVLSMLQIEGDAYRVEGGTALMRIIPAKLAVPP